MSEIKELTTAVIAEIKKRYVLIEKNFNLDVGEEELRIRQWNFIDLVTRTCAEHYKMEVNFFMAAGRSPEFFNGRAICYKLCKEMPEKPIPLAVIGAYHGKSASAIKNGIDGITEDFANTIPTFELLRDYRDIKKKIEEKLKL